MTSLVVTTQPDYSIVHKPRNKRRIFGGLSKKVTQDLSSTFRMHTDEDFSSQNSSTRSISAPNGIMRCKTQAQSLRRSYDANPSLYRSSLDDDTQKKFISWGNVQVKTHCVTLVDNPAVSCGAPIGLSWKVADDKVQKVSIDQYECCKPEPRQRLEMILPRSLRDEWLLEIGFSRTDLKEAASSVQKIHEQRHRSAQDGAWEKLNKSFKKAFTIKRNSTFAATEAKRVAID